MLAWYALVSPENDIDQESNAVDPTVDTKPGWRWLPIITEEPPSYNPSVSFCEGPEFRVETDQVVKYWNIRPKTDLEINNDKIQKVNLIDPVVLSALLDVYNTANNTTLTLEDYKVHLRSVV